MAIYHTLVNSIRNSVATYGINQITAVSMIPFALYLGGAISSNYRNTIIAQTLGKIFTDPEQNAKLLVSLVMAPWIAIYILHSALGNPRTNNSYKNKDAIHHIVPKKVVYAYPSVWVLQSVGINLHATNYKNAYYNPNVESLNLIKIKRKTHIAIHHRNDLYCSLINSIIVPSYLASYKMGKKTSKLIVSSVLVAIGKEILAVDSIIR